MSDEDRFRNELMSIGIIGYSEQEKLLDVARRCMRFGVVTGGTWALLGSPAAAPGWVAGFLSGLLAGTATCTALNYGAREELKRLVGQ